ncbi:hypothetical protein GA0061078_0011 [Bifidobacterium bohemicum]|nr:hypothetical protein GA0061078_0011 [Bifidobacterium bohemicum]
MCRFQRSNVTYSSTTYPQAQCRRVKQVKMCGDGVDCDCLVVVVKHHAGLRVGSIGGGAILNGRIEWFGR